MSKIEITNSKIAMDHGKIMGNFSKIPNDLIRSPLLTPTEKIVCIVLLSYNPSFPSYEKIMKDSNIGSKATIAKALKNLIRFKFIEIIPDSKYRSNLYRYIEHDYRKEFDFSQFNPLDREEIPISELGEITKVNFSGSDNEQVAVQEVNANKTNINILNKQINGPETPSEGSSGPVNETKKSSTNFGILTEALKSLDCKPNYFRKSDPKPTFILQGI